MPFTSSIILYIDGLETQDFFKRRSRLDFDCIIYTFMI